MYSNNGEHRSFCSSPECYNFTGGNGMVTDICSNNHCTATCAACNEGIRESPSFIKFSNMPLPMALGEKKSSKPLKKNEKIPLKCEVEDKNVACKSVSSNKDVTRSKLTCEGSIKLVDKASNRKVKGNSGKSATKYDGHFSDDDVGRKTSNSCNKMERKSDKVSNSKLKSMCDTAYASDHDIRGNVSKAAYSSNKMVGNNDLKISCDKKSPSPVHDSDHRVRGNTSKTSYSSNKMNQNRDKNEEIFDLITDDNVVVRCQCNDKNCQNACSRNEAKPQKSSNIDLSREDSRPCQQKSEKGKSSKTSLKSVEARNHNTSAGLQNSQRSNCPTKASNNRRTNPRLEGAKSCKDKSSSNLQPGKRLESIEEEHESMKTNCKFSSSANCKFNSNGCKPFPDSGRSSRSHHKPIEESCIDFMNIISDNVMESVENSMNEVLCDLSQGIFKKLAEIQTKVERQEAMMSELYGAIIEKFEQQNEDNSCQFRALLEFLMENKVNRKQQHHHEISGGGTCSKECQCDLYTDRLFSGNDNMITRATNRSSRYRSFPISISGNEKIYRNGEHNNISENRCHKCSCCQGQATEQRNFYWENQKASKRSMGGGGIQQSGDEVNKSCTRDHSRCHEKHLIDWHNPHVYNSVLNRQTISKLSYAVPYHFNSQNSLQQPSTSNNQHQSCWDRDRKEIFECNSNEDQETSGYVSEPEDNADNVSHGCDANINKNISFIDTDFLSDRLCGEDKTNSNFQNN
ncbi:uncharacterized protein isoform X1 [Musca autumnalis]|uniref:uncharacterized protein isoform X1 n=1 Tax=Musca autumnalis TaxID=221902 RepID=UPI003CE6DA8C